MPAGRRLLALGCVASIAAADWVILRRKPRWLLIGLADEPAHLATAVLVLLNVERSAKAPAVGAERSRAAARQPAWRTRDVVAFLAGSVLIDADHVPLALAPIHPRAGDPRPPTHSLLLPAALAVAGQRAAALGVCAHYLRDLASDAGVPAAAPFSRRALRVPYPLYAAAMLGLALRAGRLQPERATLSTGL